MTTKCLVKGIRNGRACASVIVGDKSCGFDGECEYKDPYNGDDGQPFDEEFHYKLTCGLHLMDEHDATYFEIGFRAAKVFFEQKIEAAAAPDLLKELQECRDLLKCVETCSRNNFENLADERVQAINAAIAKATGETK